MKKAWCFSAGVLVFAMAVLAQRSFGPQLPPLPEWSKYILLMRGDDSSDTRAARIQRFETEEDRCYVVSYVGYYNRTVSVSISCVKK